MLEELRVANFALIDEVFIEFGPGLNVLTGETGAGKTILLAALGLLLGERADTTAIRTGTDEARVEARFRADHADEELVLARSVSREGKSKCYANSSMATVGTLAELGDRLVDVHGQHEHQALLRTATHVDYLDRFCGSEQIARRERWSGILEEIRRLMHEIDRLERSAQEGAEQSELLRFQVAEIEHAELGDGEEKELGAELEVLRHAERLASAAAGAREVLSGETEGSVLDGVAKAESAVEGVSGIDTHLDEITARVHTARVELEEVARDLRTYAESVQFDPAALARAEERMALIAALKRKYGATVDDVLEFARRGTAKLARLETATAGIDGLRVRREALEEELRELGEQLHVARTKAASRFEKLVGKELAALNMGTGRLRVFLKARAADAGPGLSGTDDVEFLFSSSREEPAKPLAKIASGGEMSRVMLALKVVFGEADKIPTLIFDEIDSGVGGKTAAAVGTKLRTLARTHQVICVTHLPQIASAAGRHFSVAKVKTSDRTITAVTQLSGEERVGEIARMLSGANISETSLRHAREMLAQA